jgi:hypothetical protein
MSQQIAVSRQQIDKHAYNKKGILESGVFFWARPKVS